MTAVTKSSGGGTGAPKANTNGSSGAQLKAISAEDAQAILSNIASKIHGTSSATATTGTNADGGKSGGNDGTEEVTGADLASLRAVAFDSEEGKKVSLRAALVNRHRRKAHDVLEMSGEAFNSNFGAHFLHAFVCLILAVPLDTNIGLFPVVRTSQKYCYA